MNTKLKLIIIASIAAITLPSCIQKSRYDKVCEENYQLQEKIKDLISEASKKNLIIKDLQSQLENIQQQVSNTSTVNEDKGKDELKSVESFLNEGDMQGSLASTKVQNNALIKNV